MKKEPDKRFVKELVKMKACPEAVIRADTHLSMKEAWEAATRGDWLFWLVARNITEDNRQSLLACGAEIAATIESHSDIAKKSNDTVKAYLTGEANWEDVKSHRPSLKALDQLSGIAENAAHHAAQAVLESNIHKAASMVMSVILITSNYKLLVAAPIIVDTEQAIKDSPALSADIVRKHFACPDL